MRVLLVAMALMLMPSLALADSNIETFVRGDSTDDRLETEIYVAKTFKKEDKADVRIKVSRSSEIDDLHAATYKVSAGLEF